MLSEKIEQALCILKSHGIHSRKPYVIREDMGFVELDLIEDRVFSIHRIQCDLVRDTVLNDLIDVILAEFAASKGTLLEDEQ